MSLRPPAKLWRLQQKLYAKAKERPTYRFHQLYDKVWREDILAHAYRLCRAQRGAPGVDGETFSSIESLGLEEWLVQLREELHAKTYRPSPVRRVLIPKRGCGQRPLGIPTIRDRVVQASAKLVLEPIFEADLDDSAYGYRPKRSALNAVSAVHKALCEGHTDVVDADVSSFFDEIPHSELMQSVARRVSDSQMLKLIKSWLKVPVREEGPDGKHRMKGGRKSRRGVPQGAVISPLLGNIYINRYLRTFRARGLDRRFRSRLVNYADDFVILSRGCAEEALAWTRWAMEQIGLRLNPAKTRVCNANGESFDFLGYTFGPEYFRKDGHWYLAAQPSRKSVARLRDRVRQLLRPGNMSPWPEVVHQLNRILRGWSNYFSYGTRLMAYRAVDNFVYERVRGFLRRRHKVKGRGTRRFSREQVFGNLGVLRLRPLHVRSPSCALA